MRGRNVVLALLLVMVFCIGCRSNTGTSSTQAATVPDGGEELFMRYCSSCHGDGGQGDGTIARLLKNSPPDLTTFAERREGKFSYTELARFIDGRGEVAAHGSRIMPVWGQQFGRNLPDADVREGIVNGVVLELVLYLERIQQKEP